MKAEALLRRYLEQRREMGETELVLDGLSVEEVMRLLGIKRRGRRGRTATERARPIVPEAEGGHAVGESAFAGWREALRASGVSPEPLHVSRAAAEPTGAMEPVISRH